MTSVPSPAGLEAVAPGHRVPLDRAHHEGELPARFACRHRALRPVGGSPAVALHVAPEAGADRGAGGAVEPLRLERLGAEPAGVGDVAHQLPHLLRRGVDVHGHGVLHARQARADGRRSTIGEGNLGFAAAAALGVGAPTASRRRCAASRACRTRPDRCRCRRRGACPSARARRRTGARGPSTAPVGIRAHRRPKA